MILHVEGKKQQHAPRSGWADTTRDRERFWAGQRRQVRFLFLPALGLGVQGRKRRKREGFSARLLRLLETRPDFDSDHGSL